MSTTLTRRTAEQVLDSQGFAGRIVRPIARVTRSRQPMNPKVEVNPAVFAHDVEHTRARILAIYRRTMFRSKVKATLGR